MMFEIVKWVFLFSLIILSLYYYRNDLFRLSVLSRYIESPKTMYDLSSSARFRFVTQVVVCCIVIVMVLLYDKKIDSMRTEKLNSETKLATELETLRKNYNELNRYHSQSTSLSAGNPRSAEIADDIKEFYEDAFVNFYVMRKCSLNNRDDMFVINSALLRELGLNGLPIDIRDNIIFSAKKKYRERYMAFSCDSIDSSTTKVFDSYKNYLLTLRETLSGTF